MKKTKIYEFCIGEPTCYEIWLSVQDIIIFSCVIILILIVLLKNFIKKTKGLHHK